MKTYIVTIPIAGHLRFEVEAEDEESAIEKASDMDHEKAELEWEQLSRFNQGNVCYCPSPWEITAEEI